MNDQEALEHVLYLKGIEITDTQREAISNVVKAINIYCTNVVETVASIFQQTIMPIVDELKEFIKREEPKIAIRYGIVKIIRPYSIIRINRPIVIHCRNNC
jgi:hypothetical protein